MKQRGKHGNASRFLSILLTLVMLLGLIPPTALRASADVRKSVVTTLAEVYDGNEEKAREILDALTEAGILDEQGNMAALDIREDGRSISLDDVVSKISAGESVGALRVNGHEVSREQILEIHQVRNTLEIVKLLDEDVEITDEHVKNLDSLVSGILDGSVDMEEEVGDGLLRLKAGADGEKLAGEAEGTETGDMTLTDGKYTGPMLDGSQYEASYGFPAASSTWFTDARYKGVTADGVVTLTCADAANPGDTVTVKASLNKAQPLPVSFDWAARSGGAAASGSGTVTWNAGETGEKTFDVTVGAKGTGLAELWQGRRAFVISASNIKNALFGGNKTAWSQTVQVAAADNEAIKATYLDTTTVTGVTVGDYYNPKGLKYKYGYVKLKNIIPETGPITIELSGTASSGAIIYFINPGKTGFPFSEGSGNFIDEHKIEPYTNLYLLKNAALNPVVWNIGNGYDMTSFLLNGETWLGFGFYKENAGFSSLKIKVPKPSIHDKVTSVTVPAGTYASGEIVPVTVELNNFVYTDAGTKLTVNNTSCSLLDAAGTETRKLTFGYTVKDMDTGAINITAISGLKNIQGKDVSLDAAFPSKSFGVSDGITLVSDIKKSTINWNGVKYGISAGEDSPQVVTVMLPLTGTSQALAWVTSEAAAYKTGSQDDMPMPGYAGAKADHYLPGAYFSMDGGKTRFPVYVVMNGDTAVALAARFAPEANTERAIRKETLNLFMDPKIVTEATAYLPAWSSAKTDEAGYACFDGTGCAAAPIVLGRSWTYYVNNRVLFEKTETISRGLSDYEGLVDSYGFLKLGDDQYVLLQDTEHPDNQYDVEVVVNAAFRNAVIKGARAEDVTDIKVWYQISSRKNFTFIEPEDFSWVSSDEQTAAVTMDKDGAGHISFTGAKLGSVSFTLKVGNGTEKEAYDLAAGSFMVIAGKTPFLNVPAYSRVRTTLAGTDTDVLFSSNVTARNQAVGTTATVFTAKLYPAKEDPSSKTGYAIGGNTELWSGSFNSTAEETLTHLTVPGLKIETPGAYAVTISTVYAGGEADGVQTEREELSQTVYLVAKPAPAKITLNTLESYYVPSSAVPSITYTVTPSNAVVEYTIQKSGGPVGDRKAVSGTGISLNAQKPEGLKDTYVITVYAKTPGDEEGDWSVDSMLLSVYNEESLKLIMEDVAAGEIGGTTGGTGEDISGTTVHLDNTDKLSASYGVKDGSYRLSFDDFTALRTDMSLQKIISANYGESAFGMLADKLQWSSSDSRLASVDYKQGGIYADIENYSYVSYAPATDFLLVGKGEISEEDKVTIRATHANTGIYKEFTVTADTLKDRLYIFQFTPRVTTDVTYVNGDGVQRTLKTNEQGELAVYEPAGIPEGAVLTMSESEGEVYAGTLFAENLVSGERDIASLQLYPCNNLRLRTVSDAGLTILDPDGNPYTGTATVRAGVYKNDVYCPGALIHTVNGQVVDRNGREDTPAQVTNGKLVLGFDATQFKHDSSDESLTPLDKVTYVIEYDFGSDYRKGYAVLRAVSDKHGAAKPTDSLIRMRKTAGAAGTPQIVGQTIRQFYDGNPVSYTRDVMDYTENIGLSTRFNRVELFTDVVLPGEAVGRDEKGYATYSTAAPMDFALYTTFGERLTGQTSHTKTEAEQIVNLADLEAATLYVFPFSSAPFGRGVYEMTDANMKADGLTDEGSSPTPSARAKVQFIRDGMTVRGETLPFGVSNLSHQKDLSTNGGGKELAKEVRFDLSQSLSLGTIFGQAGANADKLLSKGFAVLKNLSSSGSTMGMNLMILPTEDPASFHIFVFINGEQWDKTEDKDGGDDDDDDDDDDTKVDYQPNKQYEDTGDYQKAVGSAGDQKDSKVDSDSDAETESETKVKFNFHGALHLVATCDPAHDKWGLSFRGGTVGAGADFEYQWSANFMCGPIPLYVVAGFGAGIDVEVGFADKDEVRAMLLDLALELSITAFAGMGFDISLINFKLGIEGTVKGKMDFLYLMPADQNGTELSLDGKIRLVAEAKVGGLISYDYSFASVGFGWKKYLGKYQDIRTAWEEQGFADITGETLSGRPYTMRLNKDGTGSITVTSEGEIENRDYLAGGGRFWNTGMTRGELLAGAGNETLTDVETNTYPHANPVLTDDGGLLLYISDNDNADEPESVASFAVWNGSGYTKKEAIKKETDRRTVDSAIAASGTKENAFAAWIRQLDIPEKEMHDSVTLDDLGMLLNSAEIYVGHYNDEEWKVERLTENFVADMAPTVASSGDRAIAAWRSLSASSYADGESDITAIFNAENQINYRYYDGSSWKEAQVAYNGSAGTVNAVSSAMLPDGTALLAYTVRTSNDPASAETFCTLINKEGQAVTTSRLTNNDYLDTNAQVVAVGDSFVLGWYAEGARDSAASGSAAFGNGSDIHLVRIDSEGSVDGNFPESLGSASSAITQNFRFSAPSGNTELKNLSVVWSRAAEEQSGDEIVQEIDAVRFYEHGNGAAEAVGITAPMTVAKTAPGFAIDTFDTFTDASGKVYALLLGTTYTEGEGVYDTVSLYDKPITSAEGEDTIDLATLKAVSDMKLASGSFADAAIETEARVDLNELTPGLNLPVELVITNIGGGTVENPEVTIDGKSKAFAGIKILPGRSATVVVPYAVPESNLKDVAYTVTAGGATASGVLALNRPDVGIYSMKVLSEQDGVRNIQVLLRNGGGIPLAGSGKTVKLAFYKDEMLKEPVGEAVTIPADTYADMDEGVSACSMSVRIADLTGNESGEIPEGGLTVFAKAWVEGVDEQNPYDNTGSVSFTGRMEKYESPSNKDTSLVANADGTYTVQADITNNSLERADLGALSAVLLDADGNVLKTVELTDSLVLGSEEKRTLTSGEISLEEIEGTPASVAIRASNEPSPQFKGHAMVLTSEIGVRFKVIFPDAAMAKNASVSFLAADGRKGEMAISEATKDDKVENAWWFTAYINALELGDAITATLHYGDHQVLTDVFSGMDYCSSVKEHPELPNGAKLQALVKALQNYGYYLQKSGWTDGKDHTPLEPAEELGSANVTAAKKAVSKLAPVKKLTGTGIGDVMFSLTLNEATKINAFFKPNKGVTVTTEEAGKVTISGETYYKVTSDKISARNLGKNYTLAVTTSKGRTATLQVSAMSYVKNVLDSKSMNDAKKYAMTAFCEYYTKAIAYAGDE